MVEKKHKKKYIYVDDDVDVEEEKPANNFLCTFRIYEMTLSFV